MPSIDSVSVKCGQSGDTAVVSVHGGTVLSWRAEGKERLFMSSKAIVDGTRAIRGGIPLVFPQFGPGTNRRFTDLPQHGIARLMRWQVASCDGASAVLTTSSSDHPEYAVIYPHSFAMRLTLTIEPSNLHVQVQVFNTGPERIDCDFLFHTYLLVADSSTDKTLSINNDWYANRDPSAEFTKHFKLSEKVIVAEEPIKEQEEQEESRNKIQLESNNLTDVVVWNPGPEKALNMSDLGKGEERIFVCVELGCIEPVDSCAIEPGESRLFSQTLRVV